MNNAVARVAGLLAVAALPLLAGLNGSAYADPELLQPAYRTAMYLCAGMLAAGGALAALLVRVEAPAGDEGRAAEPEHPHYSCPVTAPEQAPSAERA